MKIFTVLFVCSLFQAFFAQAQNDDLANLDTNYYVVGASDWKGALTVQMLNPLDFAQLKKEIELDNKARNYAYQNLKTDWRAKYDVPTPTDPNPRVPPFPLKCPPPKVCRLFGKFPDPSKAQEKVAFYTERETTRQQRIEADKESALSRLSEQKQSSAGDKANAVSDLMSQFEGEIKNVRIDLELGVNPSRKSNTTATTSSTSGKKKVSFKQGRRLGEDANTPLVREGNLVNDGPLK